MTPKPRKKSGGPIGHKKAPHRRPGKVTFPGKTPNTDETAIVKRSGTADPHLQAIYLNLLTVGMTAKKAADITQYSQATWAKQAQLDADFGERRARAIERGPGLVTSLVSKAMMEKIAEGNPWWVRFAIINGYARGMIDPDAELVKQQAEQPKRIVIMVSPEGAKYFKDEGSNGDGGGNGHAPRMIDSDATSHAAPSDSGNGTHEDNGTNGEHVSEEG